MQLTSDVFGAVVEHGAGVPTTFQENCGGLRLVRDIEMQDCCIFAVQEWSGCMVVWYLKRLVESSSQ